jgi:hypothetical protein
MKAATQVERATPGSNLIQQLHRPAQQPIPTKLHLNLPHPQPLTKSKPAIAHPRKLL